MIAAVGSFNTAKIIEAAISMSCGIAARHEYALSYPGNRHHGIRHLDGWGAVYKNRNDRLHCIRSATQISIDPTVAALDEIKSSALIVHVRNASVKTNVGISFVHPIERLVNNQQAYFFHNGFVPEIFKLIGKTQSSWDSEELFDWLLPELLTGDRFSVYKKLLLLPKTTTSANFIFVQEGNLTVCNWFSEVSKSPEYYTMHILNDAHKIVISSEGVPGIAPLGKWQSIPNKSIFQIDLRLNKIAGI